MFAPSKNYFLEKKKSLGHPESTNKLKYNFPQFLIVFSLINHQNMKS